MLDHNQARELLGKAAAEIDLDPPPAATLLKLGREATKRRRIFRTVAATVAGATVITASVAFAANSPDRSPVAQIPETTIPGQPPVAPPGTRWVGMGRAVVAVPSDWATDDVQCGLNDDKSSVVFDARGERVCLKTFAEDVSLLHIVPTSSWRAESLIAAAEPYDDIEGVEIRRGELEPTRKSAFNEGLVVASEGVAMWVDSTDRSVVSEILDSVTLLPESYVTVPVTYAPTREVEANMLEAGLQVTVVERDSALSPGTLLETRPSLGSVVAIGSTVTLVVSADAEASEWPEVWTEKSGAAIECVYAYPDGLAEQPNAFDATVTGVRVGADEGETEASPTPATLELTVNEVFAGPERSTITMHTWTFMLPADPEAAVGARILAAAGETLDLMSCGFTRQYSAADAADWRETFAPPVEGSPPLPPVSPEERQLVDAFVDFALSPGTASLSELPFASIVHLGLGDRLRASLATDALLDPAQWQLPLRGFRAAMGRASALELLAGEVRDHPSSGKLFRLSAGPHRPCRSSLITAAPSKLEGLRQISIQPVSAATESCLQWWSVDLFLDAKGSPGAGSIRGVTIDSWEP